MPSVHLEFSVFHLFPKVVFKKFIHMQSWGYAFKSQVWNGIKLNLKKSQLKMKGDKH